MCGPLPSMALPHEVDTGIPGLGHEGTDGRIDDPGRGLRLASRLRHAGDRLDGVRGEMADEGNRMGPGVEGDLEILDMGP